MANAPINDQTDQLTKIPAAGSKHTFYNRWLGIINRTTFLQAFRFAIVGLLNTGITLAIIYGLTALSVSYMLANAIGYVAGFVNSFFMNRSWTFASRGAVVKEAAFFVLVFLISYAVQFVALLVQTEWLLVPVWISQATSMVVYTAVNFVLNKIVTFTTV